MQVEFIYDGVQVTCDLDIDPWEPGSNWEPEIPEVIKLFNVFAGGVRITNLIGSHVFSDMEDAAIKRVLQMRKEAVA